MKKYTIQLLDLTRNLKLIPYASAPNNLFLNKNNTEIVTRMADGVRTSPKILALEEFDIVKITEVKDAKKRSRKASEDSSSTEQPDTEEGESGAEEESEPEQLDEEV